MTNISLKKLYTNAHIVTINDTIYLFSYESPILKVEDDKIVEVYPKYDYSRTTVKHINYFIDQYGYITLGEHNLFELDNSKRKKLLDEFVIENNY